MDTKMRAVVTLAAALACSAEAFAERGFTEEFLSGATRPQSIALLPVEATITRQQVVETTGLIDESVVFGAQFNADVAKILADKGYEVQIVDADRINADAVLQEYVVDAKRAYDEMIARYRPKKLPDRIYNAGDSARLLAAHLGVDAVAFSRMSITITPAGKAIMSALIGGTTSGASSMIGIVDGDTADLEVVQIAIAIVAPGEKTPDEIAGYVATLAAGNTKRLPGADPSQRVEVAVSDDEVLDEVESLIRE
ncbi:MAG TPA: hypothetical protein VLI71_11040 [Gammaproteobacteria bacterium]|nr:hypothetical protein [Gammaproteobacteria bacterium]